MISVYIYPKGVYNNYYKGFGGLVMKNIGNTDRIIRVIIGLGVLSLVLLLNGNLRFIGLIGLIPLFTAAIGFCPLYSIFGIKTCKN